MEARIQTEDFKAQDELAALRQQKNGGALVSFVGLVRDGDSGDSVRHLWVEHYAGMTERYLQDIMADAAKRWQLLAMRVVHRIGVIEHGEQIVFAGVLAVHRKEAFEACEFLVDHLKTEVPLWKAENDGQRQRWVRPREEDQQRKQRWQQ